MKRIHHGYVVEHDIQVKPKKHLTPGSLIIHEYPSGHYAPDRNAPSGIKIVKHNINITNSPYVPGQVISISVDLPPSLKSLRISIMDGATFNTPYIVQV